MLQIYGLLLIQRPYYIHIEGDTMNLEFLKLLALAIGAPVARSAIGWAQTAVADNKITKFELKQLFVTIFRVGTIAACEFFVAKGLLNIDMGTVETIATGALAILTDKLFGAITEKKSIRA